MTRVCSLCGVAAEAAEDSLPEGWSFAVEDGRVLSHCPACVRSNIRAIEAKLPQEWWE